jgi:hypothetical protein
MSGLCWSRVDNGKSSDAGTPQSSAPMSYIAPSFCLTSLNAPVLFSAESGAEQPVGMTVTSQLEAMIVEADVEPAGTDASGKVAGGHLRLKTYIIPYQNMKRLHPIDEVIFDGPQQAHNLVKNGRLLCASLRSKGLKSNNPSHINGECKECLLLFPQDPHDILEGDNGNGKIAPRPPRF